MGRVVSSTAMICSALGERGLYVLKMVTKLASQRNAEHPQTSLLVGSAWEVAEATATIRHAMKRGMSALVEVDVWKGDLGWCWVENHIEPQKAGPPYRLGLPERGNERLYPFVCLHGMGGAVSAPGPQARQPGDCLVVETGSRCTDEGDGAPAVCNAAPARTTKPCFESQKFFPC